MPSDAFNAGAAIARMHAGHPMAESAAGTTRVGFTLATR
jgi:hypothetical protein